MIKTANIKGAFNIKPFKKTNQSKPHYYKETVRFGALQDWFKSSESITQEFIEASCRLPSKNRSKELFESYMETFKPDVVDAKGNTPLMAVCLGTVFSLEHIQKFLNQFVRNNKNINHRNRYGSSALDYLIAKKNIPPSKYLFHSELVKRFIEAHKADMKSKNSKGQTAFLLAQALSRSYLYDILIKNGADISELDRFGRPPLVIDASNLIDNDGNDSSQRYASLQKLLKLGADVNQSDKYRNTALHHTVKAGHLAGVKLLLQYGANVKVGNSKGITPIDLAEGNDEILKLLLTASEKQKSVNKSKTKANTNKDFRQIKKAIPEERLLFSLINGYDLFYFFKNQEEINAFIGDQNKIEFLALQFKCKTKNVKQEIGRGLLNQYFRFRNPQPVARFINDLVKRVFGKPCKELAEDYPDVKRFLIEFEERDSIKSNDTGPKGFNAVAGMKNIKEKLTKLVIKPMKIRRECVENDYFTVPAPNGVLFTGPTGCGKTYMAKCLAEELGFNFEKTSYADLADSHVGETVKNIKQRFIEAKKNAPCVLLIDEFDGLAPRRNMAGTEHQYTRENVTQFLEELQSLGENNVIVVAITNDINWIDSAVLRSGRFDTTINFPLPDNETRRQIFEMYLMRYTQNKCNFRNRDFQKFVNLTQGMDCADIELVSIRSVREAIERKTELKAEYVLEAIKELQEEKLIKSPT